jgi:hypothetical protein
LAFAIELTVMSIVSPGLTKAGSTACTATAATFLSWGVTLEGTVTPSCANMFVSDWTVKGAWLVWSPVPFKPTTRP